MIENKRAVPILMADDDPEDRLLVQEAFIEARLANKLYFVEDGEELLDYLFQRGRYSEPGMAIRPGMILLDLNMPRKNGREALKEIQADPNLRHIPIIVLTTSRAEDDIRALYDLGANSFITKPITFDGLVDIVKTLSRYWFQIVKMVPEY